MINHLKGRISTFLNSETSSWTGFECWIFGSSRLPFLHLPGAEEEKEVLEAIYGPEFEVLGPTEWRLQIIAKVHLHFDTNKNHN